MKNGIVKRVLKSIGYKLIRAASSEGAWWPISLFNGFLNAAKEKVNNDTALTVSSLYACIRNVSEDIAKMPLNVYRQEGELRFQDRGHRLARLLKWQPNPDGIAMAFRETITAHAMGWGNGYAEIERDINGDVVAYHILRPDRVTMYRDRTTGRIYYKVLSQTGISVDIWASDILHLHGLGFDGVTGYNIMQYAAQSIGSAIAMDKFAGSYFANGLNPSGNIKHPAQISKEAAGRLKEQLTGEYGGAEKAHKILVLEEGMAFEKNIIDPKASQMIETRQFQVSEFCRWMRVPPHKVADLTKATFSNIEEQNTDYVTDGLLGWAQRWEQEIWVKCFNEDEKKNGYYVKHNFSALLRGNVEKRTEAYAKMWDRGIYNINEIRAMEELNPIDGGDRHFVPTNFTTLEKAIAGQNQTNAVIKDMAERMASREIKEIEQHIKFAESEPTGFKKWLNEFYEKHNKYIAQTIAPLGVNMSLMGLSLEPFLYCDNARGVFEERKNKHAKYIAANLRSYYEN